MDTQGDRSWALEPGHVVRAATKGDYPALGTVFQEAEAFHREALPEVFRRPETTFPPQVLYEQLVAGPDSAIFVADMDGELVGFVAVRKGDLPEDPLLWPRRFAVVEVLAVSRDRQFLGLGRALMEAAQRWARERDMGQMQLNVWEFNQGAIAFYQKLGYTTASRLMWRGC